jgi:surfactin synthase thioesterase subunit
MNKTALDSAWIYRFHRGTDAGVTLVCFPHAGGSASFFHPVSAALQPGVQVLAVQYPGRQERRHEPYLTTIADFADGAYAALEPILRGPVALFGHSMGATIAFEMAARMKQRLARDPVALFASGRRAPSRHRHDTVHLRDDAGIIAEMSAINGTDKRILDDEELIKMIIPPLRNDYKAIETYRYQPGPKLDCPVTVLIGDTDAHVDTDEAKAWAEHTTGPFALHTYTGGHFYLTAHRDAVVDVIAQQLRRA